MKNRKIFIDVSTYLNWVGPPTGIPRVEREIINSVVEKSNYVFLEYRVDLNRFIRIEQERILALLRTSASDVQKNQLKGASGKLKLAAESLKRRVKVNIQSFSPETKELFRLAYFLLKKNILSFKNRLHSYRSRSRDQDQLVEFSQGDILFGAGPFWAYSDLDYHIIELKEKYGIKFIPLVHDLIPIVLPHSFGPGFSDSFSKTMINIIWAADKIITVSKTSKKDISDLLENSILEERIVSSIYLGSDRLSELKQVTPSESKNYVLCVGTVEYRKSQNFALDVWRKLVDELGDKCPTLVIVGRVGFNDGMVKYQIQSDPTLIGKVKLLENVNDFDLHRLYSECLFTIYPSLYEGWGLPITESLLYGKVCITSDFGSMAEAVSTYGVKIGMRSVEGWKNEIVNLLTDLDGLRALEENIINNFSWKSWQEYGNEVSNYLEENL